MTWLPKAGGAALSDATPLGPGTADAGTSEEASRADHVHPDTGSGGGGGGAAHHETVGDGTEVTFDIAHGLDTTAIVVGAWDEDESVGVSSLILDADTVRVTFPAAPATDEGLVVVLASGGTSSGGGGVGWGNLVLPGNGPGGANDDEFDDGSIDGAWVQQTVSGTAVWTEAADAMSVKFAGQSSGHAAALLRPLPGTPAAPMSIETAVTAAGQGNHVIYGLVFTDGTGPTANSFHLRIAANGGGLVTAIGTLSNMQATIRVNTTVLPTQAYLRLRLTWTAANTFLAEVSPDGVSWTDLGFTAQAGTLTPTHFGIFATRWGGSGSAVASFEYVRVYEP